MLKQVQILLGIAATLLAASWVMYETRAMAEEAHDQAKANREVIEVLKEIHVKQQAAEDARREVIEELCREHKLKPEDCPREEPE